MKKNEGRRPNRKEPRRSTDEAKKHPSKGSQKKRKKRGESESEEEKHSPRGRGGRTGRQKSGDPDHEKRHGTRTTPKQPPGGSTLLERYAKSDKKHRKGTMGRVPGVAAHGGDIGKSKGHRTSTRKRLSLSNHGDPTTRKGASAAAGGWTVVRPKSKKSKEPKPKDQPKPPPRRSSRLTGTFQTNNV